MTLGELICNNDFDLNCNYAVYDGCWNDGGRLLWSTERDGYGNPPYEWRIREIAYITIDVAKNCLVIEVKSN